MANEKRLIDANALKEKIKFGAFGMYYDAYDVQVMPTVDAVEVVRCEECQKWDENTSLNIGMCARFQTIMRGCDFCSRGERRNKDAVD